MTSHIDPTRSEHADVVNRSQTVLPDHAAAALRKQLGLAPDAELRIAYVPGPGDAAGTYGHWKNGEHDPRVPVFTYSSMYYELLEKLDAQGLLVTRHPGTDPLPDDPNGRVQFRRHVRGSKDGVLGFWRREFRYGRGLLQHIDAFAPHVLVVSTDVPWFFWPRLSKNRVLLLSAHNTFWKMGARPTQGTTRLQLAAIARAMRSLSGAVCTSQECARQIADLSGGSLPSWTEIPQQKRGYQNLRDRKVMRDICFVGRIVRAKGMKMLLDAFSTVACDRPEMTLTFAGNGVGEEELRAQIAELGDTRVHFPGRLPAAEVHALLDRSDLLVCPTLTDFAEGLGLVVAEAAAHGVPSVASSVVPAQELFSSCCTVFEADNTAALTAELERLASNDAAYQALCAGTAENHARMLDRSLGWGSQLYQAMIGAR